MSDITKALIAQHGVCNDGVWRHVVKDNDGTICIVEFNMRQTALSDNVYVTVTVQRQHKSAKYDAVCTLQSLSAAIENYADLVMQLAAFVISDGSYKLPVDIACHIPLRKVRYIVVTQC